MKVIVAGATGFVGEGIIEKLSFDGHEIVAIVHTAHSGQSLGILHREIRQVIADVSDDAAVRSVESAFLGAEAIVYLPGLLREFPGKGITFEKVHVDGVRNLMGAAQRSNIKRWIQISALGAGPNASTGYFKTKWEAEELVRASGLDWTILRPSVIFDTKPSKRMNFVGELAAVVKAAPVLPIFGDGQYRMQPVAVEIVASAIAQALTDKSTINHSYDVGGPEKIAYEEIMKMIARAQGKNKLSIHIPFFFIDNVAAAFDWLSFFPVTHDQLTMLKEENIVHDASREAEFNATFHPKAITLGQALLTSLK